MDEDATLVPLADAASAIGCTVETVLADLRSKGGLSLNGRADQGVYAYELQGYRLAHHRRRLATGGTDAHA
jgi:hypothetical protein